MIKFRNLKNHSSRRHSRFSVNDQVDILVDQIEARYSRQGVCDQKEMSQTN